MDIQVLNEIANPARQAALSQVGASVSANAQLKALKGSPMSASGNPAPPPLEDSPEQTQEPVTPVISSVARAASAYSAAVRDGLNSDELNAIQDLAGRVRTAVSDFLSQPGLEQAENAAAVVASNPEAVQDLTASVEQAVVATLSLPEIEDEVIVNAAPPNEDLEVPAPENFVSVERITKGVEPNNPTQAVAASPALVNERASENTSVENPVTAEEGVETSSRDFRVTPASPALQSANAQSAAPATSSGDFTVSATSLPLVNEGASENTNVENPVTAAEGVETSRGDFTVTPASPALQNANAQSRVVENSVDAVNAPATSSGDFTVTAASPALQNAQAQNAEVGNPVNIPAPSVDLGQGSEGTQAQTVNPEGVIAPPEGASNQTASGQSNPQSVSGPQPGPAQSSDLFAQENAAVNPENIRNVNELVNSVVDNEFTSEAKKIFSESKVIRTVADLADFILERLREIIATKQIQKQSQSSGEIGLS